MSGRPGVLRREFLRQGGAAAAAFLFPAWCARAATAPARKPNIIVILSDDMGFSDLGCYGGEIRTPHLDALANGGIRFTQFYNTARCCPTRASLLTGLHPHQAAVGHMVNDSGMDGYRGDLNRSCVTIAEALKPAGYANYAVGKWHVTAHSGPKGPKDNWPLQRGFDHYYGTIGGCGSYYDPGTLVRDNTMISPFNDPAYAPKEYFYTDAISDHAARFVAAHARDHADTPFFMYVAYTAAHWPLHARDADVAKYKGMYDAGYGPIREKRFARMKEKGLINPAWDMAPQAEPWDTVKDKAWEARCMEVYAAQIDCMDQGIGRIVAALKAAGQFDSTLIMFLQDNGGCAESIGRDKRPAAADATHQFTAIASNAVLTDTRPKQMRSGAPVRTGVGAMPGPADTYISYGEGWANVSDTPFRYYKHFVHEGGISTPLVAHWPAGIKRAGALEHQPGQLMDIMSTCVDVAGATYPAKVGDTAITPMEGRSLVPAFAGKAIVREGLYWEHEGNRAIRTGKWKLVARGPKGPWELYDMEADRTEMHNRAAAQPDRVNQMAAQWSAWATRAHVLPWPWSNSRTKKGAR